ncbi:MAG: hypothetical protein KDB07_06515, partial [Planctomycetes bacterium]|nr:hypothetical protein [Planctomycetota bacterium]
MRVFALIALICVFASAAMAQTADGSGWIPSDPHGVIDEPSAQWMNKPGRYLVIKIPSGTFEVQPVELWLDARGVRHDQAFADAFTQNRITWPQSMSVRRYDTDKMVKALQRFRGDSEAFLRYQVKLRGVRRANEVRQVPMSEVKILRLPQTWENIWMREVASVPAQERVARVKEFDFGFRAVIENRDSELEYFSRPEQNAYALFYQSQFNYQRNAEPNNAAIYHELAAYHESRDNIDAKIGVYLDAVRHDFESEEKELFHLLIGEAMVKRLRLYQEAKAHLKSASSYAAANLLLVECHFALGENDQAVAAATALSPEGIERLALRESGDDMDQIQRRATLLKARAQVAQHQLDKAEASFKSELSDEGIAGDEAATMLASLLIYRGESRDYGDAVRVINNRASFAKRIGEARLTPEAREKIELEYDPIGSRALTLLADAQVDGAVDARSSSRPQLKDINILLDYAAILDPLNPEPFLVHGKAREIHQLWADAEGAYLDGLQIDPLHAGLNYRLGVLYLRAERTDSAADAFRRALRREPRFTAAMNRLADLALLRGDEALAEMRNAQCE